MKTRISRIAKLGLALALVIGALAGCGSDAPAGSAGLEFSDMWSRQPAAGQTNSAVYGVVSNSGDQDIRIVGASVDVTDRVELHETLMNDGVMSMREREDGFVVPAGGSFSFEPGGPHVMIMGIDPDTYPTDAIDVTFSFEAADPVFVTAQVRPLPSGAMNDAEMDHEGMDHEGMDHDS